MSKKNNLELCKKCGTEINKNNCSNSDNPHELVRIDGKYILNEIGSLINFDKGIFYTVKELFIRPGDAVREFILKDRNRLVKPITFIIICSVFYAIAQHFLSFKAGYFTLDIETQNNGKQLFMVKMYDWFSKNYSYANIIMAIPITLWIKILFKKYNYNFYEIYILLCFTLGISMVIYTLLGVIESIINYRVLQFGIIISLVYITWAIGQFFDRKIKLNYLKGFLSYIFGIVSSLIIFFFIGIVLDKLII